MTLNDQILAYLHSLTPAVSVAPGDYMTGQIDGQADQVLSWNATKLGAQPTQAQLDAAGAAADLTFRKSSMIDAVMSIRATKLAAGFSYNFNDTRGIHNIGTTDTDEVGWDKVSKLAGALMALGQSTATIQIVTNTAPVTVTAAEWQQILVAGGQFGQPIYTHSFTLEAEIAGAADHAALDAIDINAGW